MKSIPSRIDALIRRHSEETARIMVTPTQGHGLRQVKELIDLAREIEAEAEAMREALGFYADPDTWNVSGDERTGDVEAYVDSGDCSEMTEHFLGHINLDTWRERVRLYGIAALPAC